MANAVGNFYKVEIVGMLEIIDERGATQDGAAASYKFMPRQKTNSLTIQLKAKCVCKALTKPLE